VAIPPNAKLAAATTARVRFFTSVFIDMYFLPWPRPTLLWGSVTVTDIQGVLELESKTFSNN
ncbi:hypothetical protein, partial [Cutibacterium granulosum]|uniref:hypothetical protein n=1 Tax=Cutibacterium granulosum TaxID=33011 RepID=UPI002B228C3F